MNACRLDLAFDKESFLRAEFQFTTEAGDLVGMADKQYRIIIKESLETETELFNIIMPIVVHELDSAYWLAKLELTQPETIIETGLLHYVIYKENPVPGNEDSNEAIIYGTILMNKRI